MQTVLLPVGDDLYALPVGWVGEVMVTPSVTPLVTAPALVLGLFNLRGEIVPLLDTAALLGVGRVGAAAFTAVLRCPLGPAGLAATDFPQRAELDSPIGPSDLYGTVGMYRVDQRVVVLLDPTVLLAVERIGEPDVRVVRRPVATP
ncbi:chemotaxis protein CheW [Amycolatopsis sp. NPDC051128]|uniref:chemotaxis protein CheW n=1 Tax=Amycolatopsis sp. NPDC051128 TaxID=3155412 RepID=UPI00341D6975